MVFSNNWRIVSPPNDHSSRIIILFQMLSIFTSALKVGNMSFKPYFLSSKRATDSYVLSVLQRLLLHQRIYPSSRSSSLWMHKRKRIRMNAQHVGTICTVNRHTASFVFIRPMNNNAFQTNVLFLVRSNARYMNTQIKGDRRVGWG